MERASFTQAMLGAVHRLSDTRHTLLLTHHLATSIHCMIAAADGKVMSESRVPAFLHVCGRCSDGMLNM